jgi:hypothetical protein
MRIEDLASGVRRLMQDETLQTVLTEVQSEAISVFQNPNSEPERILEAHQAIQAVGILERKFDAIVADDRIQKDRES